MGVCAGKGVDPVVDMLCWGGAQRGVGVSGYALFLAVGAEWGNTSIL